MGQKVSQINAPSIQPGSYNISWDGKHSNGTILSAGLYFIQITGPSFRFTRKYTLLDGNITGRSFIQPASFSHNALGKGLLPTTVDTLVVESPGRFTLFEPIDLSSSTDINLGKLYLDRKATFLGSLEQLYDINAGERLSLKIPAVDADDEYELTVNGEYGEIVGDSLIIHPPLDVSGDYSVTLNLLDEPYDTDTATGSDSLHTLIRIKTQTAPVILHKEYFEHLAYLMAGQTDQDSIFALPLNGIEKLETGPFLYDAEGDSLEILLEISNPEMIHAYISGDTLYLYGNDANQTGQGYINIRITDPVGLFDEVQVPVIVFGRDRTLMIDGKKNYYVPWSPILDINRITSVVQFLVEEGYQEENLDRTINFSRWKQMEKLNSVTFNGRWLNELNFPGWDWEAQKVLIDSRIKELKYNNVDFVWIQNVIYQKYKNSNEISVFYEPNEFMKTGLDVSKREFEWVYLINQLHNNGISVGIGDFIADVTFARDEIAPDDWSSWMESYGNRFGVICQIAYENGVELVKAGASMINVSGTISDDDWGNLFRNDVLSPNRPIYPGPMAY